MKKIVFLLAMSALVVSGLSSCKKCTTCKATKAGQAEVDGGKTCGNSKDIKDYEDAFKALYESTGYSVSCN
jgi:hypothetical protein